MIHVPLKLAVICFGLAACRSNSSSFEKPAEWPEPVYDFSKNPLSTEKTTLGRALFYDPILSADNTISCASCHSPYNAFTHGDHNVSHGIGDSTGTRNSPPLMNLAWHTSFMWNGAINHLDMQALAPINHPDEMGENTAHVLQKLNASNFYRQLFYNAFGDSTATGENLLKAIAQFMVSLVSANSKYDQVKRNQASFTAQEQNGYALFTQHCNKCHTEPLFSNFRFENNGLPIDSSFNDYGRMQITQDPQDSLKFKVPTLRNIEFSFPYMHDGRFKTISEVLNHYTSGIKESSTLSPLLLNPMVLSSNEKVDLLAFLLTLSDREFLFNPAFAYPKELFLPAPKD
ncbi:MAG: cytochrome-c peroxidase [Bacteroidetes bacterium]|nr:cytochrome-c peroxidase [Bacteroidota bacterium]